MQQDPLLDLVLEDDSTPKPARPRRRGLKGKLGPPLAESIPESWDFPPSVSEADFAGRTVSITGKLPGELADMLDHYIGKPGVPYDSRKQAMVDGVYGLVKALHAWYADADPRISSYLNKEELAREQRMLRAQIEQLSTTVAMLEDNLTNLVGLGDIPRAQQALAKQRAILAREPDDGWRERSAAAMNALYIVQILDRLEELSHGSRNGTAAHQPAASYRD